MGNCFTQLNYKFIDRKIEKCNQQRKLKIILGRSGQFEDEKSEKKKVSDKIKEDIHLK